ncbi:hypothetical protein WR25_04559 [Diploscapter pachys]|uniref:Uncharacterized protein n=1 Tax=Diploscapter pachys TaxID=2018661 RepID=A0A2A2L520_9BILA|nr:hypothetical protein WR25_04559 [Diploscapter pachys]
MSSSNSNQTTSVNNSVKQPLAVYYKAKACNGAVSLNVLLLFLFVLPALCHAVWYCFVRDNNSHKLVIQSLHISTSYEYLSRSLVVFISQLLDICIFELRRLNLRIVNWDGSALQHSRDLIMMPVGDSNGLGKSFLVDLLEPSPHILNFNSVIEFVV